MLNSRSLNSTPGVHAPLQSMPSEYDETPVPSLVHYLSQISFLLPTESPSLNTERKCTFARWHIQAPAAQNSGNFQPRPLTCCCSPRLVGRPKFRRVTGRAVTSNCLARLGYSDSQDSGLSLAGSWPPGLWPQLLVQAVVAP